MRNSEFTQHRALYAIQLLNVLKRIFREESNLVLDVSGM